MLKKPVHIGLVWELYTLGYGYFIYANFGSENECGMSENGHGNTIGQSFKQSRT